MVDGGKMSKSLGNLYTLEDLAKHGWSAMEVRYVLLSGHYRKPLNFTFDSLHAARDQHLARGQGRRRVPLPVRRHRRDECPRVCLEIKNIQIIQMFQSVVASEHY
jgi:cysteinyl-tRNA synthetase